MTGCAGFAFGAVNGVPEIHPTICVNHTRIVKIIGLHRAGFRVAEMPARQYFRQGTIQMGRACGFGHDLGSVDDKRIVGRFGHGHARKGEAKNCGGGQCRLDCPLRHTVSSLYAAAVIKR